MKTALSLLFCAMLSVAQIQTVSQPNLYYDTDVLPRIDANFSYLGAAGTALPATCTLNQHFLLTAYVPNVQYTAVSGTPCVWAPPLGSATFGGIPLLSPAFGAPVIATLSAGENDIYTAPTCTVGALGCNRHIISVTVSAVSGTSGALTCYTQLKRGGVYYYSGIGVGSASTATVSAGVNGGTVPATMILDPGDTFAVFVTSLTGPGVYNATLSRLSMDSATPLRQVNVLAPQTGTSLVYTPTAGKNGILVSSQGLPFRTSSNIAVSLDAGMTSSAINFYLAPTGAALTASNQFGYFVAAGGLQSVALGGNIAFVPVGNSIYVTQTYNSTNELIWFWVFEF